MTNAEAIKLLRKLRDTIDRNNKYGETEEMAIQALEQEPIITSTEDNAEMTYPQVEGITPTVVNEDIYECSCGYGWDKNKTSRFHFCPNCGKAVGDGNDYKYIKSISNPTGIEFDIDISKEIESYKKLLKHPVIKHVMDMDETPVTLSVSENPNNCEMRDATPEEREAIEKYIKSISKPTGVKFGALEQEPSGDLISRGEVLENAFKIYTHECGLLEVVGVATIKDLPSVKPQERTGHWEWVQYDYNPKIGNWHCTECRCIVVECVDKNEKGGIPLYKYCPQCGAKMEVEQHG